jgi:hypothetical protein
MRANHGALRPAGGVHHTTTIPDYPAGRFSRSPFHTQQHEGRP